MSDDWLQQRVAASPAPLRERLGEQLAKLDTRVELSAALLSAACDLLDSVRGRLGDREAAFDLLVADGLLTLACEAAAYSDPERLAEACRDMGPGGALGRVANRWVVRS